MSVPTISSLPGPAVGPTISPIHTTYVSDGSIEDRWFKVTAVVISGIVVGISVGNIIYFNRLRNTFTTTDVRRTQANSSFWLNIFLAIIATIFFIWSLIRLFSKQSVTMVTTNANPQIITVPKQAPVQTQTVVTPVISKIVPTITTTTTQPEVIRTVNEVIPVPVIDDRGCLSCQSTRTAGPILTSFN